MKHTAEKSARNVFAVLLVCAAQLPGMQAARAQSADEMNSSNNPLTPSIGLNLQDQYVGRYYGLDDGVDSNAFLLRGVLPHKLFDRPQLIRATLPVVTTPDVPGIDRYTDVGDLNLFDLFLFKAEGIQFGIGPQLTAPTASRDETGTGKWQGGATFLAVKPGSWGLAGTLINWQQSFAGDDDRRDQNNLLVQPLLIRNLPGGWYLRSTATLTWDLQTGSYFLPIGAGAGKVWKVGTTVVNLFAEPQWTVVHEGDGTPKFQVFAGINFQFPL